MRARAALVLVLAAELLGCKGTSMPDSRDASTNLAVPGVDAGSDLAAPDAPGPDLEEVGLPDAGVDLAVDLPEEVGPPPDAAAPVSWVRSYGGAQGEVSANGSILEVGGGYLVGATTLSFGSEGTAWLVQLNAVGEVSWQKAYGGADDDYLASLAAGPDGRIAFGGTTASSGAGGLDAWVVRVDGAGKIVWQKTFGGPSTDALRRLLATNDGGFIFVARTQSFGKGAGDIWVVKLDATGSVAWQRSFGGDSEEEAYDLVEVPGGGYLVCGSTRSFQYPAFDDAWLLRLAADGSVVWQKRYGAPDRSEQAIAVDRTSDGGFVVAAATMPNFSSDIDLWVFKIDAQGAIAWQKRYASPEQDNVRSIRALPAGGYVLSGSTVSSTNEEKAWVLQLGGDGAVAWSQSFGGTGHEVATFAQPALDGGLIVEGMSGFGAGSYDLWILKLLADGGGTTLGKPAPPTVESTAVTPVATMAVPVVTTAVPADSAVVPVDTTATTAQQAP